ncbi:aspartic peptidase domain-containing protein [Amylostereum chailletii]|nr:aspartic peptidase domain-containing protein [Amylostereum chailletii]
MKALPLFYTVIAIPIVLVQASSLPVDEHSSLSLPRHVPFTRKRILSSRSDIPFRNFYDWGYYVNFTLGGEEYTALLDTGSADLWVNDRSGLQLSKETEQNLTLAFGVGEVVGYVAYADLTLGDYEVQDQVFVKATSMDDLEIDAIFGLGSDFLSVLFKHDENYDFSDNHTPLSNVFNQNTSASNFITLSLSRTASGDDPTSGYFTIGSYDPAFAALENSPRVPLSPPAVTRWQIALDGMTVNGQNFTFEDANETPPAAEIDSGTSFAFVSQEAADFIYSEIEGAKSCNMSGVSYWIVPCDAAANLTFGFGGEQFAVHPLDMAELAYYAQPNGTYNTVCYGTYLPFSAVNSLSNLKYFLLGDVFMRNVYTAFNFGNYTMSGNYSILTSNFPSSPPSVQFLAKTNAEEAHAEFQARRAETLLDYPPVLDPSSVDCSLVQVPY